jgi:type IX secretion system PorP/SprF family membrane protein
VYNPAEVAITQSYVHFNHRQQWMGIEGSPQLTTASFNTLIDKTYTGIGAKVSNYSRGLLRTTDLSLTYAHGFGISKSSSIFFGLSGGFISSSIDLTQLTDADLSDPAIASYLANNLQPISSFGMVFRTESGLNIGLSLPQLFAPKFNGDSHFAATEIAPFDNAFLSLYYRKRVEGKVVNKRVNGVRRRVKTSGGYAPLELYALYKYSAYDLSQFEVTAKLNVSENFYLGAGYRQAYGFAGYLGFSYNKFLLGYSYEPGNQPEAGFSSGTHEIQLSIKIGEEKTYKKAAPALKSQLKTPPSEKHTARFQQATEDPNNINHPDNVKKKKYYVVIRGFADFNGADAYKTKLVAEQYNADVFYHEAERKFYVFVFSSLKSSEAYEEARNLKNFTKLKEARVLVVEGKE